MNRKLTTEAKRTQRSQVLSVGEIPTDKTKSVSMKSFPAEGREWFWRIGISRFSRKSTLRALCASVVRYMCLCGETVNG